MFDLERILLQALPQLLVWGTGLVFAVKMLRRGGGVAEKLFFAGCICLMLQALLGPLGRLAVTEWLNEDGLRYTDVARNMLLVNIPLTLISLSGAILLILGFWKKFLSKRLEEQ